MGNRYGVMWGSACMVDTGAAGANTSTAANFANGTDYYCTSTNGTGETTPHHPMRHIGVV